MADTAEIQNQDQDMEEAPEDLQIQAWMKSIGWDPEQLDGGELEAGLDALLEKRKQLNEQMKENDEARKARKRMIDRHYEGENAVLQRQIDRIDQEVQVVAPHTPEEFQERYGKKSKALPHGTIGFRRSSDTVAVVHEGLAVAFAESHHIEVKKSVNITPLKEWAKTNPIDPEVCGFKLVRGRDEFYVRH